MRVPMKVPMKVTMICEEVIPASTGGGPRINQWAICDELRIRGHQVQVIYIPRTNNPNMGIDITALNNRGVSVASVGFDVATPFEISRMISAFIPDIIFGLSTWNIAWASAYNPPTPRVCVVGDLEHTIHAQRRQLRNPEPMSYGEIANFHIMGMQIKDISTALLKTCSAVFCTAEHSALWFQSQGLPVEYLPMPVVEPAFPGWRRRKEDMPQNAKPRILQAGHLGGIATLSAMHYLLDYVLPNMPDYTDYDWHICGGDSLLPILANRFKQYPEIQFRGYVEDIRKEILQADIFLCTTSTTVGVRTRLVEAMALGSCIVAHSNNGIGQPEFENWSNISMCDTGEEIAIEIRRLISDAELRYWMGISARQTYEEKFCTALSAGRVIDVMEEIVN